jgi:hypothetical protein
LIPNKPAENKDKNKLSERAYHRIEEWKMQNLKVAQDLFGTIKSNLPKIHKTRENSKNFRGRSEDYRGKSEDFRGKSEDFRGKEEFTGKCEDFRGKYEDSRGKNEEFSEVSKENPYFEDVFMKGLRKTDKKKHLGSYFLRVKYLSTDERLKTVSCLNSSLDSTARRPASPAKLFPISKPKTSQVSSHKTSFTPDPYNDPINAITYRERQKSLEPTKGFFVTTKVDSPKSKLLISQKFSDFYSTIKGSKVYKNSII